MPRNNLTEKVSADLAAKYIVGRQIGRGPASIILEVFDIKSYEKLAAKVVSKAKLAEKELDPSRVEDEMKILAALSHSNVVKFVEGFETTDIFYIITEYCEGGDLLGYIDEKGRLSENTARKLFVQIANAVKYIHERGICHRDIKLENVLLDGQRESAKLADFGLAKIVPREKGTNKLARVGTHCGSIQYAAPELMCSMEEYDPFAADGLKDLLRHMLDIESTSRYSIHQVLAHQWVINESSRSLCAARSPGIPVPLQPRTRHALQRLAIGSIPEETECEPTPKQTHRSPKPTCGVKYNRKRHSSLDEYTSTSLSEMLRAIVVCNANGRFDPHA